MTYAIGVDTGGTFTDIAALDDDGRVHTGKALTTPENLIEGIVASVSSLADGLGKSVEGVLSETSVFRFSGTAAINAVLTRGGAATGLITTKGFEDTTFIARAMSGWAGLNEEELRHAFRHQKPEPLVPKKLVRGVDERIDWNGDVVVALDEEGLAQATRELVEAGIEALAVCFLWSIRNTAHEQRAREVIAAVAPDLQVSTSSEVSTSVGEYERFSSTVLNAYVAPPLTRTVDNLKARLQSLGFTGELLVAQSDGGCLYPEETRPAYTMQSGPAGGVIATQREGQLIGFDNVIATDVGGTSFDVGLVVEGSWLRSTDPVVGSMHLSVPMIEVESIGAGGGSIAWVDDGGALNVGPRSAGARPGPAAYGNGGTEPTLTDADVVLGYVNPDYFLGGEMDLDAAGARTAVARVADQLGMEVEEAAAGIAAIANAKMAALLTQRVIARGYDPRDFVLFAYGGAGAMHAAFYAGELGLRTVVVPALAGALSAVGVATAPLLHQARMNDFAPMPMDAARFTENLRSLERDVVERLDNNGVAEEDREIVYAVMMRYGVQLHTVRLELESPDIDPAEVCEMFDRRYEQLYGKGSGYVDAGRFLTSFEVEGYGHPRNAQREQITEGGSDPSAAHVSQRTVIFEGAGETTDIYRHDLLRPGMSIDGPAIIEAAHTTIVVPPGHTATIDSYSNTHIALPERSYGQLESALSVGGEA